MVNEAVWKTIKEELSEKKVTLVAVSKTKPAADVKELYDLGQRDFGENYVQELVDKHDALPKDIRWHYIGHLQTNKVKYIAPFVDLIHAVDSVKLLEEIGKQAQKNNRILQVLLQLHVAKEETKFGMSEAEIMSLLEHFVKHSSNFNQVKICGLMGMASNTEDQEQVKKEFRLIHDVYQRIKETYFAEKSSFSMCSMGMSGDYKIAVEEGSNMVRIGSLLFGTRDYGAA